MNIKILICCHKKDIMTTQEPYLPIHVGKELSNLELNIIGDNTGDNISFKNQSYCELTGMYWAWKNLKNVDVIGLCHYRRYFDFYNQCKPIIPVTEFPVEDFNKLNLSIPSDILKKITKGTFITPQINNIKFTLQQDYRMMHVSEDFKILEKVFLETQSQFYKDAFHEIMYRNNKFIPCNMFIMNWGDFDNYCTWLFDVLSKVEDNVNISNYNSYQKRIFGFMSERLFNVYIRANNIRTLQKPVIFFTENNNKYNWLSLFMHIIRILRNNICVKLLNR